MSAAPQQNTLQKDILNQNEAQQNPLNDLNWMPDRGFVNRLIIELFHNSHFLPTPWRVSGEYQPGTMKKHVYVAFDGVFMFEGVYDSSWSKSPLFTRAVALRLLDIMDKGVTLQAQETADRLGAWMEETK